MLRSAVQIATLSLALAGCGYTWEPIDEDGDGWSVGNGDCWDTPEGPGGMSGADINPASDETWYDGVDANCDGRDDYDADGDGYVPTEFAGLTTEGIETSGQLPGGDCMDGLSPTEAYTPVAGFAVLAGDQIHPGAPDYFYDGVDSDCDGSDDFDQDGDGFASAFHPDQDGVYGSDCADGSFQDEDNPAGIPVADINPDASETWYDDTDQDCAGDSDYDADRDGYESGEYGGDDCDDFDPNRFPDPSIAEIWYNGVDENCDLNDGDKDGDGYVAADYPYELAKGQLAGDCWDDDDDPSGFEPLNGLSALGAADVHPGADDRFYDGIDADCLGGDDFDADGDGFASAAYADAEEIYGTDCIDGSDRDEANPADIDPALAHPGAEDAFYDGTDADCEGNSDYDADGDGYDSEAYGEGTADDCDDDDDAIKPGATEACDGSHVDEDCDGDTNERNAEGCTDFYYDSDEDGYGRTSSRCYCEPLDYWTSDNAEDCDDTAPDVSPDGSETCDGVDEDCNGEIDDGAVGGSTWYVDADSDGFGSPAGTVEACDQPSGYADDADDCDDSDADINPDAIEVCDDDDTDEDCDALVDDDDPDATGGTVWFIDGDGDGYGDADDSGAEYCDPPTGWSDSADDCDDSQGSVNPGAEEDCSDGEDTDCDGTIDNGVLGNETCPAESCAEILADDASAVDGTFWLDPTGSGTATTFLCDMTTDGGGWTLIVGWDRYHDGDGIDDFESVFTEDVNGMGRWSEESTSVAWCDYDATNDVLAYEVAVTVPNGGESMLDVNYTATGFSSSGTAMWANAGGSDRDIVCRIHDVGTNHYSAAALSWLPGYTCASTTSGTFSFNNVYTDDFGASIDSFHLGSWHRDTLWGDRSDLYWLEFWVR